MLQNKFQFQAEEVPLYQCYQYSLKQNQDDLKEFPLLLKHRIIELLLLSGTLGILTRNALSDTVLLGYQHLLLLQQHVD